MAAEAGTHGTVFREGVLGNNPVMVQLLGMCPALAVTNSLTNALVMGGAATFVVVMSNVITSLLRRQIKPHVRILIFTLTIATFVTIADLVLKAQLPEISASIGAFIPLIIVNCMIISRAEVVAIKSGVVRSLVDALAIGVGFTLALAILGAIREILGSAALLGMPFGTAAFQAAIEPHKWVIMILPPGAFLTLGLVVGVVNYFRQRGAAGGT
jgi:Na+-translocating ferredoxin:NAD+ oxidoreductase subunit E